MMMKTTCSLAIVLVGGLLHLSFGQEWDKVNLEVDLIDGFNGDSNNIESYSLAAYNGHLYIGVTNESGPMNVNGGCEVWRTAGIGGPPYDDWEQVNINGFGDTDNWEADGLVEYGGHLYVATTNKNTGCEVWRTAAVGGPPFTDWEQVNEDGFDFGTENDDARTMVVFNEYLYVGTENKIRGSQVWRTAADGGPPFTDWIQVNEDGFGDICNEEAIGIVVHDGYLYVGTEKAEPPCGDPPATGGEVWRTAGVGDPPFSDWTPVNIDGFDDSDNTTAQNMAVYDGLLYVATANAVTGAEVWRTTAVGGTPFVDWVRVDNRWNDDANNVVAVGMVVYNNLLYVGTANEVTGGEIWQYDGSEWFQVNPDGFGDPNNLGTGAGSAMAVYKEGLYAGTFNEVTGTEVWRWVSCELYLEGQSPTMLRFPPPFSVATGSLSELRGDGDFFRRTCLGSFADTPSPDPSIPPPAGNGRYYLARGDKHCTSYGDSSLEPDPRDALDLDDPCP